MRGEQQAGRGSGEWTRPGYWESGMAARGEKTEVRLPIILFVQSAHTTVRWNDRITELYSAVGAS